MQHEVVRYNQFVVVTLLLSVAVNVLAAGCIFVFVKSATEPSLVTHNPEVLLIALIYGVFFGALISFPSGIFSLLVAALLTQPKISRSILAPFGLICPLMLHIALALNAAQPLPEMRDCGLCGGRAEQLAVCISILMIGLINTIVLSYGIRQRRLLDEKITE